MHMRMPILFLGDAEFSYLKMLSNSKWVKLCIFTRWRPSSNTNSFNDMFLLTCDVHS